MNIKDLLNEIRFDLKKEGTINVKFVIASFLFNPSFRLLLNYRIGKYLSSSKWKINHFIANRYRIKQLTKRNCQLSFNSTIGKGVRFAHPIGIVIGDGAVVKDNVIIWQQVTLGSHGRKGQDFKYPVIGNNVKIFAGAKIFGGITIGDNSVIGANAVVLKDVPENHVAVGVPAHIIQVNKK